MPLQCSWCRSRGTAERCLTLEGSSHCLRCSGEAQGCSLWGSKRVAQLEANDTGLESKESQGSKRKVKSSSVVDTESDSDSDVQEVEKPPVKSKSVRLLC